MPAGAGSRPSITKPVSVRVVNCCVLGCTGGVAVETAV